MSNPDDMLDVVRRIPDWPQPLYLMDTHYVELNLLNVNVSHRVGSAVFEAISGFDRMMWDLIFLNVHDHLVNDLYAPD